MNAKLISRDTAADYFFPGRRVCFIRFACCEVESYPRPWFFWFVCPEEEEEKKRKKKRNLPPPP
jgi:hypothetical protein